MDQVSDPAIAYVCTEAAAGLSVRPGDSVCLHRGSCGAQCATQEERERERGTNERVGGHVCVWVGEGGSDAHGISWEKRSCNQTATTSGPITALQTTGANCNR